MFHILKKNGSLGNSGIVTLLILYIDKYTRNKFNPFLLTTCLERNTISSGIVEDFVTKGAEEETKFRLPYWTKSILRDFLITGNKKTKPTSSDAF